MTISHHTLVGDLVAQDYRTASVFKKYAIDFCCNGNRTIEQACNKQELDTEILLKDLDFSIRTSPAIDADFQSWSLDILADYIEKIHHWYVEAKTLEIIPYLRRICEVHGDRHPELFEIYDHFKASAGELAVHMKKEELILFPSVRKLARASETGEVVAAPSFGSVANPIAVMMKEHQTEGNRFREIALLSNNYTPPQDACNTYRVTFALLHEFEEDLHMHIHLENNILFTRAIALEQQIQRR